jgi:putative DNA primase/helicase
MFASICEEDLRYDHKRKRWFVWQEHWWSEDGNGFVFRRAKSVARMRTQAATGLEEKEKNAEIAWAIKSESRSNLTAMIDLAKSEHQLADTGEGWDSDPMLLATKNGVIDLRSGDHRPGKPSDRIRTHTDVAFDPQAQCPRFTQFLNEIFEGREELIDFIQRAVGYCLTGETREQCLFFCHGFGSNGKSVFLEIIQSLLGQYGHTVPFSTFEMDGRSAIPNDVAALAGTRLITALETNESTKLNEARIKASTGGDKMTARYLHKEFFTFTMTAKIWLSYNRAPEITDDTNGFWRRVRLIPFRRQFSEEEANKDLVAGLKAEFPAILNWAIEGCVNWQRQGLGVPPVVREATDSFRQECDPLAEYFQERIVEGPEHSVLNKVIWEDYCIWCQQNAITNRLGRKQFSQRLESRGFVQSKEGRNRNRRWSGLCLSLGPSATPSPVPGSGRVVAMPSPLPLPKNEAATP